MTDAPPMSALHRLHLLHPQTRAIVLGQFGVRVGREGEQLDAAEYERLDRIIDQVEAGEITPRSMTEDEARADEFPEASPPDVTPLRDRIKALDTAAYADFVAHWMQSGLPTVLANEDGSSVVLLRRDHHAIEALLCGYEATIDNVGLDDLFHEWCAEPPAIQHVVKSRLSEQGFTVDEVLTIGRLQTFHQILDTVTAEATDEVTAILGAAPAPGQVVPQPVADEAALALVPPDGSIAEVLAWVGDDPDRQEAAFNAEASRAKPRKGLLSKLVGMAPAELTHETADPAQMQGQQQIAVAGGASAAPGNLPPGAGDVEAPPPPATALTSGGGGGAATDQPAPSLGDFRFTSETTLPELLAHIRHLTAIAAEMAA